MFLEQWHAIARVCVCVYMYIYIIIYNPVLAHEDEDQDAKENK